MAASKTINIANKYDRVVVLVDMDCFYCQVEEKLDPSLRGKPIAVVQYNAWRGGGIIAVNYPARAQGVTRHMRGEDAKEQCPEIELVRVPSVREKADLTKYREAGKEVAAVLQSFTPLLERASVDEAYLDITEEVIAKLNTMDKVSKSAKKDPREGFLERICALLNYNKARILSNAVPGEFQLKPSELVNTYAVGYDTIGDYIQEISSHIGNDTETDEFDCEEAELNAVKKSDLKLLIGASIVSEIRAKVKERTGYECSAGIAHNKILAKLACGINKPNKQTILPLRQIKLLFSTLPVGKVKGLGGKFGEDLCNRLKIKFLGDLLPFTEAELQKSFDEKNGSWLYLIARGIDLEAVTPRFYSKSIGCCKKFPGRNAIVNLSILTHWFSELANEICDRLEVDISENNRRAKQMVISYIQEICGEDVSSSRSTNLSNYDPEAMAKLALETLKKNTDQFFKPNSDNLLNNPLKFLGISVGKFETIETNKNTLQKMFQNQAKKKLEETSSAQETQNLDSSSSNVNETPKEKENSIKKSFFAAHMKKQKESLIESQSVVDSLATSNEQEKQKPKDIKKSFFANALKRKSDDILGGSRKIDEGVDVGDDTISSGMVNMTVKDTVKHPNAENEIVFDNKMNSGAKQSLQITSCQEPGPSTQTSERPPEINLQNFHSEPGPSRQGDYTEYNEDFTNQYAEYLIPDPKPEDYVKCEKCGKSILHYTMQTHLDYHFAFEISQEQRQQFRNEIKAKMMSPPAKKPRPNASGNSNKPRNIGTQIDKFLVKPSTNNSNQVDDSDKQKCPECGNLILVSKFLEHMDYHTARKLQIEMNASQVDSLTSSGWKKGSSSNNSKAGPNKSIKAFFMSQT